MITARNIHSITSGMRTIALAGTLTIASMLPMAGLVSADGGTNEPSTPAASQATSANQFDVDPAGGLIGIQAVVVADPAGVPLQAEPSAQSEAVDVVQDGTTVDLRIDTTDTVYTDDGATRWWPVSVGGNTGWINGQSLMSPEDYAAASATTNEATRVPFDFTSDTAERIAQVSADGDGLTLRAEPDGNSDAVASIPEGTIIDLRIDDVDTVYDSAGTRWWPVSYNGQSGWVSGYYLVTPGTATETNATAPGTSTEVAPQPDTATDSDYTYVVGDWAVVRTPDSERTSLFTSASADSSSTGTIPHMALVEVLATADGGWYEVRWDTIEGFIPGELLTAGTAPRRASDATEPAPTPTPAAVSTETADPVATSAMVAGDTAIVTSESDAGVNVRESASSDAARVGFLDDGANVTIAEGPSQDDEGNDWYQVSGDDLEGWVRADLLTLATSNTTETNTTAAADVAEASDTGFSLPIAEFRFTQDYGCSNLGFYSYDPNWGCSVHDGVDMAAPQGTELMAAADGEVVVAGWCDCGLGYYVEIDHGDGVHSIYGHMAGQPSVSVGQQVSRGEAIGQVGSTGLSTGPHVHFMIREDGVTVDPKNYLPPIESASASN